MHNAPPMVDQYSIELAVIYCSAWAEHWLTDSARNCFDDEWSILPSIPFHDQMFITARFHCYFRVEIMK